MHAFSMIRGTLMLAAALLLCPPAHAQLFRAYLAVNGNDANPCTLPAPCRLLPAALNAVADGGEIWMLDSANYNTATVTIAKSVTILAVPGVQGSVIAVGGPAISITASGLKVTVRNLVIAPLAGGGGTVGISMTGASALAVERCLLTGLPGRGIDAVGDGTVDVLDSTVRDGGTWAIYLRNGITATLAGLRIMGNAGGIIAYGSAPSLTTAVISDSVISGGSHGVIAQVTVAGADANVTVTRSTVERTTGYGIFARTETVGTATVAIGGSTVANNERAWGIFNTGAAIQSLGNNQASGNLSGNTGTPVPLAPF